MVNSRLTTKVFALFLLIFAGFTVAKAQDSIYELAAGTRIKVQMDSEISSDVARVDDTFTTTVTEPVMIRGAVALPVGTVIEGRVLKVEPAASGGRPGMLGVRFETIRFASGAKRAIAGNMIIREKSSSSSLTGILAIIGGTAAGAIIGGAAKSSTGAVIGAGIGAGAGTGIALARRGKNYRIRTKEKFEIELTQNVTLPVTEF